MMAGARQRTRQRSRPPSLSGSPNGWRVAGIINELIINELIINELIIAEAIARAGACFDQMGILQGVPTGELLVHQSPLMITRRLPIIAPKARRGAMPPATNELRLAS